jgi:hypothetical protein
VDDVQLTHAKQRCDCKVCAAAVHQLLVVVLSKATFERRRFDGSDVGVGIRVDFWSLDRGILFLM